MQTGSEGQEAGRHGGWQSQLASSRMERVARHRILGGAAEPGFLPRALVPRRGSSALRWRSGRLSAGPFSHKLC